MVVLSFLYTMSGSGPLLFSSWHLFNHFFIFIMTRCGPVLLFHYGRLWSSPSCSSRQARVLSLLFIMTGCGSLLHFPIVGCVSLHSFHHWWYWFSLSFSSSQKEGLSCFSSWQVVLLSFLFIIVGNGHLFSFFSSWQKVDLASSYIMAGWVTLLSFHHGR